MCEFLLFVSLCFVVVFKQKTAYDMRISDWISDVCSSDLPASCQGLVIPSSLRIFHRVHRVIKPHLLRPGHGAGVECPGVRSAQPRRHRQILRRLRKPLAERRLPGVRCREVSRPHPEPSRRPTALPEPSRNPPRTIPLPTAGLARHLPPSKPSITPAGRSYTNTHKNKSNCY